MKELLLAYQDLRIAQFPALIQAVCKTLTDAEASVRSLLPPLLSAILPLVSTSTLAPHLPILLLHATSALSSIFPAVRVDAVRVLGVLLDEGGAGCDRIADGWETGSGGRGEGGRVLEGLLAVLGVGGKGETAGSNAPLGTAVRSQLPTDATKDISCRELTSHAIFQSKLVVFQALLKFLSHALADRSLTPSSTSRTSTFSFLAPSFATPQAFEQFAASLEASSTASGAGKGKARAGEWALDLSGWERGDLELEGGSGSNGGEVDKGHKITVSAKSAVLVSQEAKPLLTWFCVRRLTGTLPGIASAPPFHVPRFGTFGFLAFSADGLIRFNGRPFADVVFDPCLLQLAWPNSAPHPGQRPNLGAPVSPRGHAEAHAALLPVLGEDI